MRCVLGALKNFNKKEFSRLRRMTYTTKRFETAHLKKGNRIKDYPCYEKFRAIYKKPYSGVSLRLFPFKK